MSELINWIKKGYENGKSKAELNNLLVNAGWDINAINKAFDTIDIEQQLLADRFIKNSYSDTPRPVTLPNIEPVEILSQKTEKTLDIKVPKLRNPFKPKETSKVYKCPRCNTEMVSQDVKEFIDKMLEDYKNG